MAETIQGIARALFPTSRRSRRREDGAGGDFQSWLNKDGTGEEKTPERSPLTQRPMTSMEDMLLLARMRDQIRNARGDKAAKTNVYAKAGDGEETAPGAQRTFLFMNQSGNQNAKPFAKVV